VSHNDVALITALKGCVPDAPSSIVGDVPRALDEVVLRGLARNPNDRYATALELAAALENALVPASQREIGEWVSRVGGDVLAERREVIRCIENEDVGSDEAAPAPTPTPRATIELETLAMIKATTTTTTSMPRRRVDFRVVGSAVAFAALGIALLRGATVLTP